MFDGVGGSCTMGIKLNERGKTMTREQLITELTKVQNLAKNADRDIMTIAAMMDNDQIAAHIERNR